VTAARPYHHGNLRTALLDSAEQVLAESGAGALSLREVARRVGVSHAAPRRHFADRKALLDALAAEGYERLGRELDEALGGASGFDAQLVAFAHVYVNFAAGHAALLELMFAAKHGSVGLSGAADRTFAAPLAAILDAQGRDEVVPGHPEEVATVVFAALQGLATLVSAGWLEADRLDAIVDDAVVRLLDGLRPRRVS
jgi:AcrR family transcriptional regulator